MPVLSLILPCYNPVQGWEQRVQDNVRQLSAHIADIELILVNDGSEKNLEQNISSLKQSLPGLKVISYPANKGKGYAVRQGIANATAPYIIYTDIDFPYTKESILAVYEKLTKEHYDVVVGIKNEQYYHNVPPMRKAISRILSRMSKTLLNINITDTQCGLKGFNRKGAAVWQQGTINRYLFDLEAVYRAEHRSLKILALPVALKEGVQFSKLKMKILVGELVDFLKLFVRR